MTKIFANIFFHRWLDPHLIIHNAYTMCVYMHLYMYHLFIFTFHDIFIIIVYFKNMEESSKISKFYKSQRNDLQLRYLNIKYTNKKSC